MIVMWRKVAGLIARWILPAHDNPRGFILTTLLGIAGALIATYIGQAIGWHHPNEGAGFIGATVGAIIILAVWHAITRRNYVQSESHRLL